MNPSFTACTLLYGDFNQLHLRTLKTLLDTTPPEVEVRIGLNEVCSASLGWICNWLKNPGLRRALQAPPTDTVNIFSQEDGDGRLVKLYSAGGSNLRKYPMMRFMFGHARPWCHQLFSDWVIWLDDDTWFRRNGWLEQLAALHEDVNVRYVGERWFQAYAPGQLEFIQAQPWYRGIPPFEKDGKNQFVFATGGFWAVRTEEIMALQWPPPSIVHNGGDTMLGEAFRQQGVPLTIFPTKTLGVEVNDADRRGYREKPTGAR